MGFFLSVLGNDFLFLNFNMRTQSTCFLSLISFLCGVDSGVIVDGWKLSTVLSCHRSTSAVANSPPGYQLLTDKRHRQTLFSSREMCILRSEERGEFVLLEDTTQYIWWVQFILERSIYLFREIASASKEPLRDEDKVQNLWDQEIALVKLGESYRDQKWDLFIPLGYILPKQLV